MNKVVPIDKSSTILTIVLAFLFLGEGITWLKGAAVVLIAIGTFLMIEKKAVTGNKAERKSWLLYAILSAVFASLTSILGKVGIEGVESNLGTAIRTGVVLVMAWFIVFVKGKQHTLKEVPKKELGFICLSGLATGSFVAVLLQGAAGRACQRGRAHRQAEHSGLHRIFRRRVP